MRSLVMAVSSLFLLCLLALSAADTTPTTSKVLGIISGDSLRVRTADKKEVEIRLQGIDAPDSGQPFSKEARQFLIKQAQDKQAEVTILDTDRYGRSVGWVIIDGKNLSHESVKSGLAWWYRRYAKDEKTLEKLEAEAKKAKRGLWADKNPTPPWEYRRANRDKEGQRRENSRSEKQDE